MAKNGETKFAVMKRDQRRKGEMFLCSSEFKDKLCTPAIRALFVFGVYLYLTHNHDHIPIAHTLPSLRSSLRVGDTTNRSRTRRTRLV